MTRKARTPIEESVIESLSNHLASLGHIISTDESITDRPDWVFSLDDHRVGCELSVLGREEIIFWHKQPLDVTDGTQWHATYPIEPHMWVEKVLDNKSRKSSDYRRRATSDEIWLLLHQRSALNVDMYSMDLFSYRLLLYQITNQPHPFSQVWFCFGDGRVDQIFRIGDAKLPKPILDVETASYPTGWFRATSKRNVPTGSKIDFDFRTLPVSKRIALPCLDGERALHRTLLVRQIVRKLLARCVPQPGRESDRADFGRA